MSALRLVPLTVLLALAACVAKPVTAPPPAPIRPAPPPLPAPIVVEPAWEDRPLTPGQWVYRTDPRGSIAYYGLSGGDAALTLRCDRTAQRVVLSRQGAPGQVVLTATTGARAYLAQAVPGTAPPYVAVEIAARDPQLDAIAFSRGQFMVSLEGAPDLHLPSWAEVSRVIEDCRG